MTGLNSFVNGLLLSLIASAVSLSAALLLFRRTYHLSILLSIFAASYVLAAWIVYTRRNPLVPYKEGETKTRREKDDCEKGAVEPKEPGKAANIKGRVRDFLMNPIPALLWSAAQLAILTAVLYSFLDIGATYYR